MSRRPKRPSGLALLSGRRPHVLHGYLDLLPLLGESLDGRTKELIRIALHVQSRYRPGLRGSVPRALAEGASVDEIVDAVILSLPEAGLGRVADALAVVAEFVDQSSGGGDNSGSSSTASRRRGKESRPA